MGYYVFLEAGWDVVIASPAGGPIPIDAGSLGGDFFTDSAKKFLHDPVAMAQFSHSKKLDDITTESNFDCFFASGGHGTIGDFVNCESMRKLIETMYKEKKPIASVCHGPMCLIDCKKENGEPLLKGNTVTVFSNEEETQVGLCELMKNSVGFLVEDKFRELGADYQAGPAWSDTVKVSSDNLLITGQNPGSSVSTAKKLVELVIG